MRHGTWLRDPKTGESRGMVRRCGADGVPLLHKGPKGHLIAVLDEVECPEGCEWKLDKHKRRQAVKKAGAPTKAAKTTAVKE